MPALSSKKLSSRGEHAVRPEALANVPGEHSAHEPSVAETLPAESIETR
jgi:hypothetical protein